MTGNRDLDEGNDMDGNYLSLDYDQATFVSYYDNELPPRPNQEFITNVFFGSGKNTNANADDVTTGGSDISILTTNSNLITDPDDNNTSVGVRCQQ